MEICTFEDVSSTFVPYYDSILDEEQKSQLGEIQMSSVCADKVISLGLSSFLKKD